ncbi:beta galactosidase jelly roll domain-containing protein [bacterium]|nr:beta galactosidase jelly roll domain-containing protein [bacterium]
MNKWILLFIPLVCTISSARDLRREISLHAGWRFEIGDNLDYAQPGYDDSDWERIRVPSTWESEGFPGYDGYAWYRMHMKFPKQLEDKSLYIKLGYIDDVDEVYINGRFLNGSGSFPPEYQSAYNHERIYHLPHNMLRFGDENVIAVRVYDDYLDGGIRNGSIGIYSYPMISMKMDLSGQWLFSPGDAPEWADTEYDDSDWDRMQIPSNWENQDFPFHDGYGWYRKHITIPDKFKADRLILALGLIDDADEVYFNGTKIGRTGSFPGEGSGNYYGNSWQEDRFYMVPPHLMRWNETNTIAVRVYDYQGPGGIYDGPLGLTTKEAYIKYRRNKKSFDHWLKQLFDSWD